MPKLRLFTEPLGTTNGLEGVVSGLEVVPLGVPTREVVPVLGLGEAVPLIEVALPPCVVVPELPEIGGTLLGALGRPGVTVVSIVEGESGGKGVAVKGLGVTGFLLLGIWLIVVERVFCC